VQSVHNDYNIVSRCISPHTALPGQPATGRFPPYYWLSRIDRRCSRGQELGILPDAVASLTVCALLLSPDVAYFPSGDDCPSDEAYSFAMFSWRGRQTQQSFPAETGLWSMTPPSGVKILCVILPADARHDLNCFFMVTGFLSGVEQPIEGRCVVGGHHNHITSTTATFDTPLAAQLPFPRACETANFRHTAPPRCGRSLFSHVGTLNVERSRSGVG